MTHDNSIQFLRYTQATLIRKNLFSNINNAADIAQSASDPLRFYKLNDARH
jgi:hypothetical protein